MKRIDIGNNDFSLRQLVELASIAPVVLMENGVPRVALVSVDEDTIESFALSNNPGFMAIIERSRESYRRNGGISLEDLRRALEEAS